jgi:hypothetical protein
MSEDVLGRIERDLAVMQRAIGLQLSFGKGILVFDISLALAAAGASSIGLWLGTDSLQQITFAAVMFFVLVGLFLQSRRTNHEVNMQVLMSVTVYVIVWISACAYMMAAVVGSNMGIERTALLHLTSVGILIVFTLILVRAALRSREQYYCLGLALSTFLAGMLLPILGLHHIYSLAHGFMAIGYVTCFAIQRAQLRAAVASHAAN